MRVVCAIVEPGGPLNLGWFEPPGMFLLPNLEMSSNEFSEDKGIGSRKAPKAEVHFEKIKIWISFNYIVLYSTGTKAGEGRRMAENPGQLIHVRKQRGKLFITTRQRTFSHSCADEVSVLSINILI